MRHTEGFKEDGTLPKVKRKNIMQITYMMVLKLVTNQVREQILSVSLRVHGTM